MQTFVPMVGGLMLALLMTTAGAAQAATFVYVSNAEDGDIGAYALLPDGSLVPGARVAAGKPVMPMSVSPDRRFLYAAVRSKPFTVITYAIDPKTGALTRRSDARWRRACRTSGWTGPEPSCSAPPMAATS